MNFALIESYRRVNVIMRCLFSALQLCEGDVSTFFLFFKRCNKRPLPGIALKARVLEISETFSSFFFFSPFSCPCLTLEGRSREISSSAPSIENISEKREFLLFGISTLIADAFEEFLLTPAEHHVNTERYSDDFFLLLADVLHLTTSSRSEKKE